ncbi:MAG TPA: hypothetical protein VII92_11055 [Anaerolineae bacterium]
MAIAKVLCDRVESLKPAGEPPGRPLCALPDRRQKTYNVFLPCFSRLKQEWMIIPLYTIASVRAGFCM